MKEAQFYTALEGGHVVCQLCPHTCKLTEGKVGICGVRQNLGGVLYSLVYEKAAAVHVDPIEKKPLFHVYPGSASFSIAAMGCNFHCRFCQNHALSQVQGEPGGQPVTSRQVVDAAVSRGCKTIACTYTEPTVYFEYALEIARLAQAEEIATVFVTNGYINDAPLRELAPFLTAANVDLKGWNKDFYRRVIGGDLDNVLATLKLMKELGVWVEVTTLLVPDQIGETDLQEIARFISRELGVETPWHISRYHPDYQYTQTPATPLSMLQRGREIGLAAGLRYVYSGNIPGDKGEHTYCPQCGKKVIERYGFQILAYHVHNGGCRFCGAVLDGVG
ncbi:AmmeMemoRadiSam system radical SAM enzyme, partial [bacterium]|nr:AmmeMemoRadiSam system radical SAM enzyme [bacterium]